VSPRAETWGVTLLVAAMIVFMTWPQVATLATHAYDHYDVYFNLWRLGWVQRALTTAPARLFDGNIFYPEPRALTFSDAMIVEGVIGTPLAMIGLPPVLVHNLLLLGAILASAVGMFVLVRHLTGSAGAGVAAAVIFAFAPYRFDHFMHMELQWTVWMPWAFWALHRTFEHGFWRDGLLTGLFVSLQMLSSIYYGVFLVLLLGLVTLLLLLATPRGQLVRSFSRLVPAAVVVFLLCGVYALPYVATRAEVGDRGMNEVSMFSARPSSYLVATPDNIVYGKAFASRGRTERRLFPGLLAVTLAIVGLFSGRGPTVTIAYLLALVLAFELSLGLSGYSYRFLLNHVSMFGGFRALARLGIFVVFFVAVLAGYGYSAIADAQRTVGRRILFAVVVGALLMEYRVRPLKLVPYANDAPPLYAWLAEQPRGVVAELPLGDFDPEISYFSTFHWQPIVNGYSGYKPASYLSRLEAVAGFPDERALRRLRQDNVRYLVVHLSRYPADEAVIIIDALKVYYRLRELGRWFDGAGEAVVFAIR
jgi:hypothetical protein